MEAVAILVQLLFNAQQNSYTCVWMSLFWVLRIVRSTPCIFLPNWGWLELPCEQWGSSPPAAPYCRVLPSEYCLPHHGWCPPRSARSPGGERRISSHVVVGFLLRTVPRVHKVQYRSQVRYHTRACDLLHPCKSRPRPRPLLGWVHVYKKENE